MNSSATFPRYQLRRPRRGFKGARSHVAAPSEATRTRWRTACGIDLPVHYVEDIDHVDADDLACVAAARQIGALR